MMSDAEDFPNRTSRYLAVNGDPVHLLSQHQSSEIVFTSVGGLVIAKLSLVDGSVELGDGCTPTGAARQVTETFWRMFTANFRSYTELHRECSCLRNEVKELRAQVATLVKQQDVRDAELVRVQNENKQLRMSLGTGVRFSHTTS